MFATQMFPWFSEGIKEGLATTAVNLDIGRSYLGTFTGMSFYRRTVEGLFPGFTDPTVGAAVGLGLANTVILENLLIKENQKEVDFYCIINKRENWICSRYCKCSYTRV